ncbi:MAG: rod shape-determining protein MreD [Anaerolineae bacterium]
MERSIINPYLAGALLLIVALVQTSVMPNFLLFGVVPDLMLLVVVSWTLLRNSREGIAWALAGGFLLDLLSSGPFGALSVSLSLSTLAIGIGGLGVFQGSSWLPAIASILATGLHNLVYVTILRLSGRAVPWMTGLLQVTIPCMIWNAMAIYPIYWFLRRLNHRVT